MTLDEKYEAIVKSKKALLSDVVSYISKVYSVSKNDILEKPKFYIKNILEKIKINNQKACELRRERKKIRDDLDDLERSFCKTATGEIGSGKNDGGKENRVEGRMIEKSKLREQLRILYMESRLLEVSIKDCNKLLASFIDLVPQLHYKTILKETYIYGYKDFEIAIEHSYVNDYIRIARFKGINCLKDILLKFFEKTKVITK